MKQTDLILKNGVIYTMAREGDVVEALAVRDGKIVYTGTTEEVLGACEAPQVVDLAGKTMLPGMGDSHLHFFAYCQTHTTVDLGGCTSKAEAIGKLAARAAETPKGQWIKGSNFDESKWDADNDHLPTKADLDLVSPDHPVMMKRVCLHTAVARKDFHRCPEGGYQPEEKMSVYDAVCMFTKNLHYAAGQDAVLGTLEPGKFADMVVIDRDIFKIPADEIMDIQVEKTYLAGREVYSK